MKKLLLNLDELAVESYETEKQPASRGTVVGHYGTSDTLDRSCAQSCHGGWSCTC